ncbi:cupin domain-containing protein [Aquabacterium sp. A7-Y]|uniref:cupin domain-containing protein n=1 Tax=Aquabacterium sp. A7-Y TaxID=1349605 RepID=UPI00223E21E1|nr:cupin domain-containing protein [Aquabacterium sp. A7-Y]MCW7537276.1 cupin domain-containing protein [Aquabacterium sp. A7-Y]
MKLFNPNQVSFAEGAVRVEGVVKALGLDLRRKVLTSRDPEAQRLRKLLPVSNVPPGFEKYQLPFVLQPSQLFVTSAPPGAEVAEHSHDEGDGVRFIADGSVIYNGTELVAGDWMYIPQGTPYSLRIGDRGALMCYCYCCSCAGRADIAEWVTNPPLERFLP